ncbi:MAG: 2-amino-4-hydroxy-6-hydroxymethyldihydropteridine diphosphokinase [Dehalococcoidia bacterium]|nr:2-amino-4-hydroxy-6-hydroxymethyldihydropteridine diphosphokinase [Dehalococcoidia bacterium]
MAIYVALGSNLGNREANLRMALRHLEPLARATRVSSLYETDPVGPEGQPQYYNGVAEIVTGLEPEALLRHLKNIEHEVGRRPGPRWGPRPIDLDLLLYDEVVIEGDFLAIPHPTMAERDFVMVPLAELAPDLVHPALPGTPASLCEAKGFRCQRVRAPRA